MTTQCYTVQQCGSSYQGLINASAQLAKQTTTTHRARGAAQLIMALGLAFGAYVRNKLLKQAMKEQMPTITKKLESLKVGGGVIVEVKDYVNTHGELMQRGLTLFGSIHIAGWGDNYKSALSVAKNRKSFAAAPPIGYSTRYSYVWIEKVAEDEGQRIDRGKGGFTPEW